jgi:hydrogenase-4 membrane subunit HyfE
VSTAWLFAGLSGLVPLAGGAMVVAGLGLLLARGAAGLGGVLAVQGGALAVALLALAAERGSWAVLGLAGVTLAAKVAVLPRAGAWLAQRLEAPRRVAGGAAVAGVAVAGVAVAGVAVAGVAVAGAAVAGLVLAVAGEAGVGRLGAGLAAFALGAVALAGRRDLAGQAAGAVGMESGLVLLIAVSGAPAWLGLASLMLPGAAALAVVRRALGPRGEG